MQTLTNYAAWESKKIKIMPPQRISWAVGSLMGKGVISLHPAMKWTATYTPLQAKDRMQTEGSSSYILISVVCCLLGLFFFLCLVDIQYYFVSGILPNHISIHCKMIITISLVPICHHTQLLTPLVIITLSLVMCRTSRGDCKQGNTLSFLMLTETFNINKNIISFNPHRNLEKQILLLLLLHR